MERLHGAPEGGEQGGAVKRTLGLQDDGLAAAEGQVGQGVLQAHALGQSQRVVQRGELGVVMPEAAAAEGGATGGAVHGEDGLEAGGRVGGEQHALMGSLLGQAEEGGRSHDGGRFVGAAVKKNGHACGVAAQDSTEALSAQVTGLGNRRFAA